MDTIVLEILARIFLGLAIGFCISLTGVGGGVLVMPALVSVLGMPPSISVGTAALYSFLTKIYATYKHFNFRTIDFSTSALFLLGAVPTDILVSLMINRHVNSLARDSFELAQFQDNLRKFIAVVIIGAVGLLVLNLLHKFRVSTREKSSDQQSIVDCSGVRKKAGILAAGTVVGALIGSTSISGVLIITFLIMFVGLSPSMTVGTSILIALVLTLVTTSIYASGSQVEYGTALLMTIGAMIGVPWGSKLSTKLPGLLLHSVMVAVVLIAGAIMLFSNMN